MFSGKVEGKKFFLLHDGKRISTQTPTEPDGLERILKQLPFTLVYAFFLERDGEHVAEVKASYLADFVMTQLPVTLEFDIEDDQLGQIINQTISNNAVALFNVYCDCGLQTVNTKFTTS
jgi:hypothetical protein